MPKYTNPELTSWKTKGYMNFVHYPQFKETHSKIQDNKDRQLLAFIYFTGARPGEVTEMKREDVTVDGSKLIFRVPTLKLNKKAAEPVRTVRFIEWPNFTQFPELKEFWSAVQPLPNGFYIFGWLKMYHNPRDYIRKHLGIAAYFYRHNLFSLMSLAGGSDLEIKEAKGAKSEISVLPYKHLSKAGMEKRARLMTKAIK